MPSNDLIPTIVLSASGILFASFLGGALSAKSKLPTILYLWLIIICAMVAFEAIYRISIANAYSGFEQASARYFFRLVQILFGIIGLLSTVGILLSKKKQKT